MKKHVKKIICVILLLIAIAPADPYIYGVLTQDINKMIPSEDNVFTNNVMDKAEGLSMRVFMEVIALPKLEALSSSFDKNSEIERCL